MATIYDVAKAAQTSSATVSRVINGRQGVKAEVVNRINSVMEAMDFQPRWKVMDRKRFLVFVPEHKRCFEDGYVAGVASGISDATFGIGYGLQLRPFFSQGKNIRDLRQLYMQEAVSGCLLISLFQGYSLPQRLDMAGLPHVVVGHKHEDDDIHQVLVDDFDAGCSATKFLLSLGHRRIAMVSFSHLDHGHLDRYRGFAETMVQAGLETPPCLQTNQALFEDGKSAARQLLSPRERPTAVIVTNEDLAAGFQAEAKGMGISIPKDLSILAFEETQKLSLMEPAITAMQTPAYLMGIEAVKMLHGMLTVEKKSQESASMTKHINIPLVVRHSTAAIG
jgi:DNA-binding LacI/PurR family transcriptional regulator